MNLNHLKFVKKLHCYSSATGLSKYFSQSAVEVVSKDVKYPPILDVTPEGKLRNERQNFYDRVRSLPSVEEKQYAISSAREHTVPVYYVSSVAARYCAVPFQPYITRTHLIRGLPQKYQEIDVDEVFTELQPHLSRVIASQVTDRWKTGVSLGDRISYELVSLIYRMLSLKQDFLQNSAFDMNPRIDSYWWHGDFFSKKDYLNEKNLCFQFHDQPKFAVRIRAPLAPIVSLDDSLCASADVLCYNYHPDCVGLAHAKRKYVSSVPGFWPGDPCEHPLVSFHSTENISKHKTKMDHTETLVSPTFEDGFGIMSSFGWLVGIAMNQGFTPYHDVTYPLLTQTVLTDGQDWHFFVYQLNTMCFHNDVDLKNKRNICWSSGKLRLFEAVENGELKGVNDTVFKNLLRFFLNSPQVPENVKLKPYLSTRTMSDEEFLVLKEKLLKMFSNRPDPNAHKYEVPLWQHIYKWHPDAPPSPHVKLQ